MNKELNLFGEQGITTFVPPTKADIAQKAVQFVFQLKKGLASVNSIESLILIKAYKEMFKQVEENVHFEKLLDGDMDMELRRSESEKSFNYGGVVLTQKVRNNYNYDNCGHSEYNEIKAQIKTLQARLKEIEVGLQSIIKTGMTMVDPDTGEILQPPEISPTMSTSVRFQ